jgi:copper(I)-binding protein
MKRISLLLLAALSLAACGGDDSTSDGPSSDDAAVEPVMVEHAWARATGPGQPSGAIYFDLTVRDDDTLLGAAVPSSVAASAEIHEVVEVGTSADGSGMSGEMDGMSGEMDGMSGEMDGMSSTEGSDDMEMDMAGAMTMQELTEGLSLTGGQTVSFEPGSYHVMLPALTEPLAVGDEFEMTLDFATAADVTVTIVVAETAP